MEFVDQMIRREFEEGQIITYYELVRRLPDISKKHAEVILDIPHITEKDCFSVLKVNTSEDHSVTIDLGPDPVYESNMIWHELVILFNEEGIDTMYYRQRSFL